MKKFIVFVILANLASFQLYADDARDLYPFSNDAQAAQFQHMLESFRCLVCQNQNLSDSYAPLARDLKQKLYLLVKQGRSDNEIMQYMTSRYGDFILFNPPVKWVTYLLWFGPLLFSLVGLRIFLRVC